MAAFNLKMRKRELETERRSLSNAFDKSPRDLSFALKIKAIDDEIAQCTEQLRLKQIQSSEDLQ
jgi:hypothetical protein